MHTDTPPIVPGRDPSQEQEEPAQACGPDDHVPADAELLRLIEDHPGLTLRALAALVWPGLSWTAATSRTWGWQVPPRPGVCGNRLQELNAAAWLADRLQDLVVLGAVDQGPRDRREADPRAGLTFYPTPRPAKVAAHDILQGRQVGELPELRQAGAERITTTPAAPVRWGHA